MDTTMAHQRKLYLVSAMFRSTKTIWLKLRGSGTSTVTTNYPYCSTCNSPMCCKRPSTIWIFVVQIAQLSFFHIFPLTLAISPPFFTNLQSLQSRWHSRSFLERSSRVAGSLPDPDTTWSQYGAAHVRSTTTSSGCEWPRLRQKEEIPYINMSCNIYIYMSPPNVMYISSTRLTTSSANKTK